MNNYSFSLFVLIVCLLQVSCDPDDPKPVNPEELITTLIYTLTPNNGQSPVVISFKDVDGDGGNPPIISTPDLMANTVYSGSLTLLDESQTPEEDVTLEVENEKEEHQLFFIPSNDKINVLYSDKDANDFPVGLTSELTTSDAGQVELKIVLRHEPVKDNPGVSSGIIDQADGESDIEVTFDIEIK